MGLQQLLMMPSRNKKSWRAAAITPDPDLYNMLASATGFKNLYGLDFHAKVGTLSASELAQCKYVYAPDCQFAAASILADDESNWADVKAAYAAAGLGRPQRLLVTHHDICRWNTESVDYYTDANIHDKGPMWNLSTITTFPGEAIDLPPHTALDPGYQSTQSGLSFADAKAILDADGWTWSNYASNPWGANIEPYAFQKPSSKQFRFISARTDVDNDDWIDALVELIVAHLNDSDLELDGFMGQFSKAFHFNTNLRDGTGRGPGYPANDNPNSTGITLYLLEYWTRTRLGGPAEIDTSWDTSDDTTDWTAWATATEYSIGDMVTNDSKNYVAASNGTSGGTAPTHTSGTVSDGGVDWTYDTTLGRFPVASGHMWDLPANNAYEYINGTVKLAAALRAAMPAGKELHWCLCFPTTEVGIWQYGSTSIRLDYRNDYQALFGGSLQDAQDALLAKMVELKGYCDGLIIPPSAQTGADPNSASVTLEPAGWWEALQDQPMKIQYANIS